MALVIPLPFSEALHGSLLPGESNTHSLTNTQDLSWVIWCKASIFNLQFYDCPGLVPGPALNLPKVGKVYLKEQSKMGLGRYKREKILHLDPVRFKMIEMAARAWCRVSRWLVKPTWQKFLVLRDECVIHHQSLHSTQLTALLTIILNKWMHKRRDDQLNLNSSKL